MGLRYTVLFVLVLIMSAVPALGQYGLGRGRHVRQSNNSGFGLGYGDRLDNNLRAGSGGRNTTALRDYYGSTIGRYQTQRIGNALVTGNLAGLGNFRGNIGYTAPNEFRGNLGSNELYDFHRRSYTPPQSYGRAPGANLASSNPYSGSQFLQRSGAGVSVGNVASGGYNSYNATAYSGARLGVSPLNYSQPARFSQQTLAQGMDARGNVVRVNTSPLKGLTYEPLYKPQDFQYKAPNATPYSGITPPDAESDASATQAAPVAAQPFADSMLIQNTTLPAIGQRLGEQLRRSGLTKPAERESVSDRAGQMQAMNRSMFGAMREREQVETGRDVYLDLLRRIEEQSTKDPDAPSPEPDTQVTLEKILSKLDYEMPSVDSFVGQGDHPLNRAMSRAEQAMAGERYFDAEQYYSAALRFEPNYPPALVGQANARIGAGMYLSATRRLRQLFDDHPQMISARYRRPLLPCESRLATVQSNLRSNLAGDEPLAEMAFVLAYLGHQRQDVDQVTQALDRMQELAGNDPLLPLLRRLWGQTDADGKSAG